MGGERLWQLVVYVFELVTVAITRSEVTQWELSSHIRRQANVVGTAFGGKPFRFDSKIWRVILLALVFSTLFAGGTGGEILLFPGEELPA